MITNFARTSVMQLVVE